MERIMDKQQIIEKILKDEPRGFRKKFLDNPKKALEELSGQSLKDWKVEVKRVPKKTILFALPEDLPSPNEVDEKLLNEIAAGSGTYSECSHGGQSCAHTKVCNKCHSQSDSDPFSGSF
jgi:hypothetical protein